MQVNLLQYCISVSGLLLYVYLLYLGFSRRLFRHFPVFFSFILWCLLRDLARWGVLLEFGYDSRVYYHTYYGTAFIDPLVQISLLLHIYWLVKEETSRGHWWILTLFTAMVGVYTLRLEQPEPYILFHTLTLYFQVLLCLLVHWQWLGRPDLWLGKNLQGILYGLSIMIALEAVNYGLHLFQGLDIEVFLVVSQVAGLIPFLIYALSMDRLDLPRTVSAGIRTELELVESNLRRAVRCLR